MYVCVYINNITLVVTPNSTGNSMQAAAARNDLVQLLEKKKNYIKQKIR